MFEETLEIKYLEKYTTFCDFTKTLNILQIVKSINFLLACHFNAKIIWNIVKSKKGKEGT